MLTLLDLLTALLPLLYTLAAVNYAVYFVRKDAFAARTCTPFLFATALVHLGFFVVRYLHVDRYPIANRPEVLSAIALALTVVYLYVERFQRSQTTGVFVVSTVALAQLAASTLLPHAADPEPALLTQTSWLLGLLRGSALRAHVRVALQ
jgi:ABC-type transport system involved in cytochrome c biogenesis permease subunit